MIARAAAAAATVLIAIATPAPARSALAAPFAGRIYLILPFENTGEDPSLAWMQTGLARAVGEDLLGRGVAVVDDEERAVFLEGSGLPSDTYPALASAIEVGRRMRARAGGIRPDRLLLGRFNLTDGSINLTARSIDLETEKARPWVSRQGRVASLLGVEQELARALASDEGLPEPRGRSADVPLLAFETYCRAMAETDLKRRLQLLQRAVHEYPAYARAAYQGAALLAREERWDEAAEMLKKAGPEPFPYEAEFHLISAASALSRNDPATAVAQARRAVQFADTLRAHLLLGRAYLASGDRPQALAELEKAQSVDPTDPDVEELRRAIGGEATGTTRRSP